MTPQDLIQSAEFLWRNQEIYTDTVASNLMQLIVDYAKVCAPERERLKHAAGTAMNGILTLLDGTVIDLRQI